MKTDLSKKTRLLIIIISILLHCLLLYLIFIAYITEQAEKKQVSEKQLVRAQHPFVVLAESPKTQPSPPMHHPTTQSPTPQPKEQPATPTTISTETTLTPQQNQLPQEKEKTNRDIPTKKPATITDEHAHSSRNTKLRLPEKKVTQSYNELFPSVVLPKLSEQASKRENIDRTHKPATPALNMKDITKSYFQVMAQEKHREGIESTRTGEGITLQCKLNAEQMAKARYQTKIFRTLQDSITAMSDNNISTADNRETTAFLTFTIDKKGKMLSLALHHKDKDLIVKKVEALLKKAAFSAGLFPQIPKAINQEEITFAMPITITLNKGDNKCHLYYAGK